MTRRLVATLLCITFAAPASAQTLRIGLQEDPDTLDDAKNWSFVGRVVMTSICDKLVDIAPDGSIVPMLAASWETAADGKAITFKLRPGVRFHDGEPFDAAAVKFSLWHQTWIWGFTADLKGYVPYPDGLIRLRNVKYSNGRI